MKTRTRIALTFFLITLAIMIVLSGAVYYFVIKYTFTDFYKRLETRAAVAAGIMLENESATAFQQMRDRILEKLPKEEDYIFEITENKNFQKEGEELHLPEAFFNDIIAGQVSRYQKDNVFFSGILYQKDNRSYIVIVSAENYYYSHHLVNLRRILLLAIISVSLLVFSVSVVFSRYVFNPVREITNQVKEINSQNLHLRLTTSSIHDDVNELKMTFNTMLDRLETSFATQNNFISNASHELGTPLTGIIGEADVALSKSRDPEEYRESLNIILKEAERLERITRSLLFLAQTGFDGKKQKMEILRVDQLLWDVKETIDRLNPRNKVYIDLSLIPDNPLKLKILGNAQLLHLAISNIVSNACKYSSNKVVTLSIGTTDEHVVIVVKDVGIGIPESELKYIYDPFYRASNTQNFEGYGIGLPLARNIVRQHRGTIVVNSRVNEGTTVRLTFPFANIRNINA
ncbi:MAG TPA: ATP-binding protein [Ohtaekwangia sp.]|uniref:HAMP domain-containing sensor histidine kinase n=1 Tax=Ohtaekwangia sp. TaxID=2066019 RepID=UPI002F924F1C